MMETNKGVLIGTFIKKHKILSFLGFLKNKFSLNLNEVNVYSIRSNKEEYLVTFKTYDKEIYLKNILNSTVMHVKNKCIFSINALNRLIEVENYKDGKIDWDKYKYKLIILTNNELIIENINKINDKCIFLD